MEVLNNIYIFCSHSSLLIVSPNPGRFTVFLSLVEGDNPPQEVEETAQGNF